MGYNVGGHPSYRVSPHIDGNALSLQVDKMPKASMNFFAKFCAAGISTKQRMVRDQRLQLADPRLIASRDYYGRLRNSILQTHVRTQDLEVFADALPPLLGQKLRDDGQRNRFKLLGEAYLDFWGGLDAKPFTAQRGHVDIAGLTITVNPEVRIRTAHGDEQAVKLRFNAKAISQQERLTMSYLMNRAKAEEGWPRTLQMGIYDVERKVILPAPVPSDDFELGLIGQAAAYIHMWRALDSASEDLLS